LPSGADAVKPAGSLSLDAFGDKGAISAMITAKGACFRAPGSAEKKPQSGIDSSVTTVPGRPWRGQAAP
jgi:hypothetical protein